MRNLDPREELSTVIESIIFSKLHSKSAVRGGGTSASKLVRQIAVFVALCTATAPALAQNWQSQTESHGQAIVETGRAALGNSMVRRSVNKPNARRSDDRTARTCVNAAQMRDSGDRGRKLERLFALCRQAGY